MVKDFVDKTKQVVLALTIWHLLILGEYLVFKV